MKIALDAMGGDNAPYAQVEGAVLAAKEYGIEIILCGDKGTLTECLKVAAKHHITYKVKNLPISIKHASQVVGMHESPVDVFKNKKDSSLMVAIGLVKNGEAAAIVSSGNTGALMAASLLELGRIKGVARPSIAAVFPSSLGRMLILDVGANVVCKPTHLQQFAVMGSIYCKYVFGVENPKVGILNIGGEETKGNELVLEASKLIKQSDLNFIGNVEGNEILGGKAHVVVCDGFVGNIVLKFAESFAKNLVSIMKKDITKQGVFTKLGGYLMKPVIKGLMKKVDYDEVGCAPLLGVNGNCFKSHGGANAKAIRSALVNAAQSSGSLVHKHIEENIKKYAEAE